MKRENIDRKKNRMKRHLKIKRKFNRINNGLPRLVVTKTNAHIHALVVDDLKNITLVSSSSVQLKLPNGNKINAAKVGEDIAKKAVKMQIKRVNFDRNGFKFHGRIKMLADAAKKNGLEF